MSPIDLPDDEPKIEQKGTSGRQIQPLKSDERAQEIAKRRSATRSCSRQEIQTKHRGRQVAAATAPQTENAAVIRLRHCYGETCRPPLQVHKSPAICFQIAGRQFWRRPTLARPIVALPSGLQRFTAVFGMGTGGATALGSPESDAGRAIRRFRGEVSRYRTLGTVIGDR